MKLAISYHPNLIRLKLIRAEAVATYTKLETILSRQLMISFLISKNIKKNGNPDKIGNVDARFNQSSKFQDHMSITENV